MARLNRTGLVLLVGVLSAGFLGGAAGCDKMRGRDETRDPKIAAGPKSLYYRLGGEPAITAVVDDFVNNAAGDPKVNFDRKNPPHPRTWDATPENVAKVKRQLVLFIAQATGGPKNYEGQSMLEAHRGMEITDAEFDALAGHLKNTLVKLNVPQREQDELMKVVGSTKPDIINK
jgi:hemoglobin